MLLLNNIFLIDDIPFDIDVEDYASIFKQNSKLVR